MTPEEKSLLERIYKMAEENNSILRGIRRSSRISTIFRIFYWVVILGAGAASYYYLQPYLTSILHLYDQVQTQAQGVQTNLNAVQNAASSFRGLFPK